jgi:hypothetical protein
MRHPRQSSPTDLPVARRLCHRWLFLTETDQANSMKIEIAVPAKLTNGQFGTAENCMSNQRNNLLLEDGYILCSENPGENKAV